MSVRRVREAIGDLVDVVAVDVLVVVVVVVIILASFSRASCRFCIIFLSLSILDNGRLVEGGGVLRGSSGSLGCRPRAFRVSGMSGLGRLSLRTSISSSDSPLGSLGSHLGFFVSVACCASPIFVVASLFRLFSSSASDLSSMASSPTVATHGFVLGIVTDTFNFPSGPHDMVGGPCGPLTRLRTSSSRKLST